MLARDAERLAQPPRARGRAARASSSPRRRRICSRPSRRLERADQHRGGAPLLLADEVQAPVDPVGAVDVRVPGRPEHRGVPRCAAAVAVRRRILGVVRLDLDDPCRRRRRRAASTPISSGATSWTLRAKNCAREAQNSCDDSAGLAGRLEQLPRAAAEVGRGRRARWRRPRRGARRARAPRRGAASRPRPPGPCRAGSSARCARRRSGRGCPRPRRASAARRRARRR